MTEHSPADDSAGPPSTNASAQLPEGAFLPPVEPPSAGFIVQLFVVPALIVAAVIGVYLLFGRLASGEADWRELVADLRSDNSHTRWRGANGLAQLLEADSLREKTTRPDPDRPMEPLSKDQDLARELSVSLAQALAQAQGDADHQRLVEYLIKSLGWMDVPEVVLPALTQAWTQASDPFLKQQALIALGVLAGRSQQRGEPLESDELTNLLIEVTEQEPGVLRHLATYNLGLLGTPRAEARLQALLADSDLNTRLNAAVGLARSGAAESLPVFEAVLSGAGATPFDPQQVKTESEAEAYFERKQQAINALTAAASLKGTLTESQTAAWVRLVEPLADAADAEVRHKAIETLHALRSSPAADSSAAR